MCSLHVSVNMLLLFNMYGEREENATLVAKSLWITRI